jgi:type II secretory pathway predicted ATPase ExeA
MLKIMDENLRYIRHFGLIAPPFNGIPDRRFIWFGDKQLEILAHLKVGIEESKGVLLLLGEEGSGKSVLLESLLRILAEEVAVAILREARISVDRFFSWLVSEFKIDKKISTKGAFLEHFRAFLLKAQSAGRKVVLVIENAENQDDEILEQARLLSNMEENGEKLLSVLLVGDGELDRKLMEHRHRALLQRAAVRCRAEPFSLEETDAYIRHRMMAAGLFLRIFTPEAVEAIWKLSGGIANAIDLICDHALMRGYFEQQRTIDGKMLSRYATEARKAFGGVKGGALSFGGGAHLNSKSAFPGRRFYMKAAAVGITLAVLVLLSGVLQHLNLPEEKPTPVTAPLAPVTLYFESGSGNLSGRAFSELDRIADFLRKKPEARATIKGYTDLKEPRKGKVRTAQSSADAAKNYLAEKGVDPNRIEAIGMGPERISDGGRAPEDPKQIPRVEIEIRNASLPTSGKR